MESFDSPSGLESLRRPPGTGWPPSLPARAADVGLGVDHHGASFSDELRRSGSSRAVAERVDSGRRHSERIADRRASRPRTERPTRPQEQESRPVAAGRRAQERDELERTEAVEGPSRPTRAEEPVRLGTAREGVAAAEFRAEPRPAVTTEAPSGTQAFGPAVQTPVTPGGGPTLVPPPASNAATRPAATPAQSPSRPAATPAPRPVAAPPPRPDVQRAAEVLDQLKAAIRPGLRRAVVQLDPGNLGSVTIRVAVGRGSVSGRIEVERAETLELVERHAPELRAALSAAGLEVGELEVALGGDADRRATPDPRSADSTRRPSARGDSNERSAPVLPRPAVLDPDGIDFYA